MVTDREVRRLMELLGKGKSLASAAAIDRLVHHSIILELNLPSYRLEHSTAHKQARTEV
jgi:DNA replication protein DnaC